MDRLNRIRMLIGDAGVQKLQSATVMVVGCGAVGSFAIEALARSGVGNIIVVDFDTVEASNINRQLFALDSTIGRSKVDVATARIHDINPDIRVCAINAFFDGNTDITPRPDFVIDAIDTTESKIALYRWCRANNIPFISSMGAALKSDPARVCVSKLSKTTVCPLAAKVRGIVRTTDIGDFPVVFSTEPARRPSGAGKSFGSIITVTGVFGLMLANYTIEQLIAQ